jgi:hypothetical protein
MKMNAETSPAYAEYKTCIDACLACITACNHCASSCLQEPDAGMMTRCIQLDMECAAVCYAAAQLMSLGSDHSRSFCHLCAEICLACAEECGKHEYEHCRACATICKKCADECNSM